MSAIIQNAIKCDNCALIVDNDSNFCKKCGYAIKRADNLIDNQPNDILREIYKHIDNKFEIKFVFDIYGLCIYLNIELNNIILNYKINTYFVNDDWFETDTKILCTKEQRISGYFPLTTHYLYEYIHIDKMLKQEQNIKLQNRDIFASICLIDYIDELKEAIIKFNRNNEDYKIYIETLSIYIEPVKELIEDVD